MQTKKVNIGLSISKNYNKVTIEVLDEPIDFESEEELRGKIRKVFTILQEEIDLQFERIEQKQ